MSTSRWIAFLLAAFALSATAASAQQVPLATEMRIEGLLRYDDAIPRPEDVLGHQIGTRHTETHLVVEYFESVARVSERVRVREHGLTHEGRPLVHAVVTSPANHARIDEIRLANYRLSDAPGSLTGSELAEMPTIVFLGYSVHGNEASGTEAALLTLYHLAAGSGPAVDSILANVVVVIDPMLNPDGRNRFVGWVNQNRGSVHTTDSQDREHREPWPGGRTNHYWFDLNRDWLPGRQPESRARLALFHYWRPQLVADFHEMGGDATYFFQPGIQSRTNPNTPGLNQELTAEIARYHARALDELGQLYFTEEVFDDFYYGKGSTYPDVNGAVGILFEQASSSALESETRNGPLPYAVTIRNQFATSLSTLAAAHDLRIDLLAASSEFYSNASRVVGGFGVGAYVLDLTRGMDRALELAEILILHRISIHELADSVSVAGRRFAPGQALLIPADQPQGRFLRAAVERVTSFRDSLFYDVSAWTLPLAYDVELYELAAVEDGVGPLYVPGARSSGSATDQPGEGVALVVPWDGLPAAAFLSRIQREGISARIMTRPITAELTSGLASYDAGALIIPLDQPEKGRQTVMDLAGRLAAESGTEARLALSGLTPEGPDLGGRSSVILDRPRVALLTGPGTSSTRSGEVWSFLTERLALPVSLLDLETIPSADLERYDVIVFAGGSAVDSLLGTLVDWVGAGGRLIAMGSAVENVAAAGPVELSEIELNIDSLTASAPWADRGAARGAHVVGGAILEVELDATHPLSFGIGSSVPVFRGTSTFFEAPIGASIVGRYAKAPVLGGWVSAERLSLIPGSVAVHVESKGQGTIVLLADEPVFRGFWMGSARLLSNAVMLGGLF